MDSGKFRKDLYYRLRSQKVEIPPLRERDGDIAHLWQHFTSQSAQQLKQKVPISSEDALKKLNQYEFAGNVRELEAMAFQAVSQFKHYIDQQEIDLILGIQKNLSPSNHTERTHLS